MAARLKAGDCVCLIGPLGAGKTTFVRGAARALGIKDRTFSPTFTLAHEMAAPGRRPVRVAHLDFYRLTGRAEERGLLDYLDGRHVVFVEWADRDRTFWPRRVVKVRIGRRADRRRRIAVTWPAAS